MDKVFVLSLHRTGTRSTCRLLQALGYRPLHWPFKVGGVDVAAAVSGREADLDHVWNVVRPITETFDAFADVPFPVLYPQIHAAYPDARFVLMHRSPRAWLRSVGGHVGQRPFGPVERVQYWRYLKDKPVGLADVSSHRLMAMQARHMAEVIDYFQAEPARLAVIGLDEPDAGERLQMFLGYPGLYPMPKVGASGDEENAERFQARLRQSRGSLERAAFAVGRAGGNPVFRRHHARLLEQAGRGEEARAELARAEELEAALREREARRKAQAVAPAAEGPAAAAVAAPRKKAKAPAKA
jgi:hypothetical protein